MADRDPPAAVRIPIARPWMDDCEAEAVRRPIGNGWVTQGPEVAAFEREFAGYVGAPHACAVSNCTSALHLALLALGVGSHDEVVTVSHSFIATANSVRYCGATPVFVDIGPGTFNIDPLRIEAAISPRTKAILCVHQMGMPCDLSRILAIARCHNLPAIEDAACAIGSEILGQSGWERIGRPHGDIACFSFHPRKLVTTGDGGMLTTGSPEYDAKFRLWRQHGMSVPDSVRHSANDVIFEAYEELGFNYRLTDIQAAIGRAQLKKLPEMLRSRRFLAARYGELLADIPGVRPPLEPEWARSNWQSYCVRLPDRCDQRTIMRKMMSEGIATRRGIMCAHREAAYSRMPSPPLPESESAQDRCILLPIYHGLSGEDQDRVVAAFARAVG
jgi:dTDP-4-amino-4,6-dideoxygalactose transaminase